MSQENQSNQNNDNDNQAQEPLTTSPNTTDTIREVEKEEKSKEWEQLASEILENSTSSPLIELVCYLEYAINSSKLQPEEALQVINGKRSLLFLDNQSKKERKAALAVFDEVERLKQTVSYITREFVREECGVWGAVFSDEDCDTVIAKVRRLAIEGKYKHSGTYWIANALAADGVICPQLPE